MIDTINPGVAATIMGAAALLLFAAAAGPAYATRLRAQQQWENELAARQAIRLAPREPDLAPPDLVLPDAYLELAFAPAVPVPAARQTAHDGTIGRGAPPARAQERGPALRPGRNGAIGQNGAIGSTRLIGRDQAITGSGVVVAGRGSTGNEIMAGSSPAPAASSSPTLSEKGGASVIAAPRRQ